MSLSPSLLRPAGRSRCLNSTVRFCRPGTWSPGLARKSGSRLSSDFSGQHLVEVFREVARVLRDDGTLWLKLGRFLLWELGQLRETGEHLGEGFGQTPHGSLLAFRPPMAAAQKSSPTSLNSSRFTTLQSQIRRRSNFGGIPARNSTKRRSRRMFRARNRARYALALRNPNPFFGRPPPPFPPVASCIPRHRPSAQEQRAGQDFPRPSATAPGRSCKYR